MIFTTYGSSMMCQACGAISAHNGDYCSSIWKLKGPGWYPLAEREERLFTNRSNRPGDDMKDELRTDSDPTAWRTWRTSQNQLWQLRQPAPPLEFPGEQECLPTCMPRFERKNKSYCCSSLVVSKMYPRVGERSGSKSMMVLL